jgi:membrane-bound lytic murein transglycosylase B
MRVGPSALIALVGLLSLVVADVAPQTPAQTPPIVTQQPFEDWLGALIKEAQERGYSDSLIDQTLVGLEPLQRVVASDRSQAELTITFDRYYDNLITPVLVGRGRARAHEERELLDRVEDAFGVQRRVVLAIWGIESRFGGNTGRTPIFRALATLAWEPRRADFFRGQLFDALTMVSRGHIEAEAMTGSWAGAMGQPQFMPSSYLTYAVDFDNDGRRDIWRSTPDVLASIANYLKGNGWDKERTWGREVTLSDPARDRIRDAVPTRVSGCYAMRNMTEHRPLDEWQKLGVRSLDGGSLPEVEVPAALVQAGRRSFLVYPNYDAILRYNCAHHYALTVGLFAELLN